MTMIRSHFAPDNIEGIKVGDKVYFHVTNLEQDYDVPHGIAMIGANTSELDHAGSDRNFYMGTKTGRSLAILLHGFLFCSASGNAGICQGICKDGKHTIDLDLRRRDTEMI